MIHRELALLFDETVALYLRLTATAAAIYGQGAISGPRRTVLVALARSGPQTVAQLARARAQSRQRLQPLVNHLVREGLLELAENPAHARSPLVVLSPAGRTAIRRILETEDSLRARLRLDIPARRLTTAAAVLRDVRLALASQMDGILRDARRRQSRANSSRRSRN